MVIPTPDDEAVVPSAPAATPTPEPAAAKKPPRPQLTRAQRRARTAALAVLTREAYEPVRLADYDPRAELRVLLGLPADDDDGPRRAFFFVAGEFIGYDSESPSASLRVVRAGDRSVTLRYGLYAPDDEPCCPSSGYARVRFQWDGTSLLPVETIPPAFERAPAT
jgi:LppP/LprE lipoprotein